MPKDQNKLKKKQPSPPPSDYDSEDDSDYVDGEDSTEYTSISDDSFQSDPNESPRTNSVLRMFKTLNRALKNEERKQLELNRNSSPYRRNESRKEYDSENEDEPSQCNRKRRYGKHNEYDDRRANSSSSSKSSSFEIQKKKRRSKMNTDYSSCEEDGTENSDEEDWNKSDKKHFNIILNGGDEYSANHFDDDKYIQRSIENEECNSEDEAIFMKDKYMRLENNVSEPEVKSSKKKIEIPKNMEEDYLELLDLKKNFVEQLKNKPNNKILLNSLRECNTNIRNLIKKTRHINTKLYYSLMYEEQEKHKNKEDTEINYFKKKISNGEQVHIMQEIQEINSHMYIDKPYRLSILQSNMPAKYKAIAMQKLNTMASMEPTDNEYFKLKNWIDAFMKIPFGITRNLNISIADGVDKCHDFIEQAKNTLDTCAYGMNDAKIQIMQMIGQWLVNPSAIGTSIAIHGPPGTGKTSIVKDGISKILGREFAFIALGGGGDSSFLEGHSYTYEGSTWGKIVQILMECKSMNPVIYFDELDKISDTARGQEIIGILTHLTDTTQNSQFHDKYFSEISFDISKCLFIFSYNDETKVNPILRDRLYRIKTKGYDTKDKLIIAKKYLLPKICQQVAFREDEIIIPDDTINYIINSQHLTQGESGVRNLKRCLEIIYTKLNLFRVVREDNTFLNSYINMKVSFPYTVTRKDLDILIRKDDTVNQTLLSMYI